jgi:hypothetical protein
MSLGAGTTRAVACARYSHAHSAAPSALTSSSSGGPPFRCFIWRRTTWSVGTAEKRGTIGRYSTAQRHGRPYPHQRARADGGIALDSIPAAGRPCSLMGPRPCGSQAIGATMGAGASARSRGGRLGTMNRVPHMAHSTTDPRSVSAARSTAGQHRFGQRIMTVMGSPPPRVTCGRGDEVASRLSIGERNRTKYSIRRAAKPETGQPITCWSGGGRFVRALRSKLVVPGDTAGAGPRVNERDNSPAENP